MQDKKPALAITILCLTLLLSACVAPSAAMSSPTRPSATETLFQISTLDALRAGVYEGALTIGELRRHGDFGLGAFDALDGEIVVAGGQVYRVDDRGVVHVADDAATTPFAAVTFFEPDATAALRESFTCVQLQSYLDALLPSPNVPYAIRVAGDFADLTVRSVPRQQAPYPPLDDALAKQVVFEQQNIAGDLIGFRLPQYLDQANVAGYHFHFLSTDRQVGGHVLGCMTDAVTVTFDAIDEIQMAIPQTAAFRAAVPPEETNTAAESTPLAVFGAFGASIAEPWNQVIHHTLLAAQEAGAIDYTYADEIGFAGDIDGVLRAAIVASAPDVIFGDAFGNEAAVSAVAQDHPKIAFVFGSDEGPRAPNFSVFDSWTYEAAYLGGMLAGGATKSNRVGVVAGFPEGSVNQAVNAFIAGAKAVNPDVAVSTVFIDSWYDLEAAGNAARVLIQAGADVLFAERPGVVEAAAGQGVYTIGNLVDQTGVAPDYVLSSVVWKMGPVVDYVLAQVRSDSYSAQDLVDLITLATGGVRLAPINRDVAGGIPDALVAQIGATQAAIIGGRFQAPSDDSRPPASTNDIVLGALYNLSGDQSGLDGPSAQGAALAVAQANAGGGIAGRAIHLVVADGESKPTILAAKSADILARHPNVSALMGLSDTDMVLAAAPVAAAAERLFLTSGATSPRLPEQAPGYLFLACFGDNVQAAAGAEWAYEAAGARTVSILYASDSTYTELLHGYFRTRFEELGGKVLAVEGFRSGDAADLAEAVGRLQPADLIYLAAAPDDALPGVLTLRAANHAVPILGGDGFDVAELWADQPDVSQVFFTTHAYLGEDNIDPHVVAFREAFIEANPGEQPDAFAALGYDAANLLLEAIRQAGSSEPQAVRQALAAIRQFDGVTGQLGFLPGSQIPVKSVSVLGVDAGSVRLIEQVMPEQVPAP